MFERLSQAISIGFVEQGVIQSEDQELYEYGVRQGLIMLLNILTILMVGILLHMSVHCIVFLLSYSVLRIFAGGYHAKTPVRCYFFFTLIVTVVLLVLKLMPLGADSSSILFGVGAFIVVLLSPVEDSNKPLDMAEQHIYRKRTYIVLVLEAVAFFIALVFMIEPIFSSISCGCFSLSILLIAGKIKNTRQKVAKCN